LKKRSTIFNGVKCQKCKTKWDLKTLKERKDYETAICPKCGGNLWFYKEKDDR